MKNQIRTPQDITKLGTILSVWAHPDDESFLAAGIMATALQNVQRVVCLTATKGEAGSWDKSKWPVLDIAETRARELEKALDIIGVKEHKWLNFRDGECNCGDDMRAIGQILETINDVKPDTILTFGPEGLTGHTDHQTVSRWVDAAVEKAEFKPAIYHYIESREWYETVGKEMDEKFNLYFAIDEPPLIEEKEADIFYKLPKAMSKCKCDALKAQESQTSGMFDQFSDKEMQQMLDHEAYVLASR